MKSLEKSQDKIQKICDKIRKETIQPARDEAQEIITTGHKRAEELIKVAEQQAEEIIRHARKQMQQERSIFNSSLEQAAKQAVEALRQRIEERFFNEELSSLMQKQLADPSVIADLINGLVKAIEKDGLSVDFTVVIPKAVAADDVSALLFEGLQKRLKERPLQIGMFNGGAQVKLIDKKMTLDLSDEAIKELLADYVRGDFRELIFSK